MDYYVIKFSSLPRHEAWKERVLPDAGVPLSVTFADSLTDETPVENENDFE